MLTKKQEASFITVQDLLKRNDKKIPFRSIEKCHLHFNGPGNAGFGVKRTALLLPESVMLLVAPLCCGRHGTIAGKKSGYDERMFYLYITEKNLVTGNYLTKINQAAKKILEICNPKVIYLCMTCVDAIMGTDLNRIAMKLQNETGTRVVASFMDPITRESKKAPMIAVQQTLFSALEKKTKKNDCVNIIGGFVPLDLHSEIKQYLYDSGIKNIYQISECKSFEEYQLMSSSFLNIVINSQCLAAAEDMKNKFNISYVLFENVYGIKRIVEQYEKLSDYLTINVSDNDIQTAENSFENFCNKYGKKTFGIGEAINGNPFELALTLLEKNIDVKFVFRNIITKTDLKYIELINLIKGDLKIYSGVHPSVQSGCIEPVDVAIGLDAGYFLSNCVNVCWNMEKQTLGFNGLCSLLSEIESCIINPVLHKELMHGNYLTV